MVLTVEPSSMSSPKRALQRKIKEAGTRTGLEAYTLDNLPIGSTRLVFQEKIAFELWEVWRDSKQGFTDMDKDGDLQNGVRVQMDKLYLIMVKKSSEQVAGRESKPALEERREHYSLIHIGCGNIFSGGGAPLQHGPIGEERTHNKFVNFFLVRDRCLKEMRMRDCHW